MCEIVMDHADGMKCMFLKFTFSCFFKCKINTRMTHFLRLKSYIPQTGVIFLALLVPIHGGGGLTNQVNLRGGGECV